MSNQQHHLWTDRIWLEEVTRWIRIRLELIGIRINGAIAQPHIRPWGTVLRVPTNKGEVYFKATSSELVHEARLTEMLSSSFPEYIPEILAIHTDRGWMLMRDGGQRLREVLQNAPDLRHWEKLLPEYAELQVAVAGSVHELLASGVPDRRLSLFPSLYNSLISNQDILCIGHHEGLRSSEVNHLSGLSQILADMCARLLAFAIPASLDHGDFHDGNIFLQGSRYIFFDWGDSGITHPFFSLRTVIVSVENTLGLDEGSPELRRLVDAFLEPWERFDTRDRLVQAFHLAQRLWAVNAALRWQLVVLPLFGSEREQYSHAVPSLLREFLEINLHSQQGAE